MIEHQWSHGSPRRAATRASSTRASHRQAGAPWHGVFMSPCCGYVDLPTAGELYEAMWASESDKGSSTACAYGDRSDRAGLAASLDRAGLQLADARAGGRDQRRHWERIRTSNVVAKRLQAGAARLSAGAVTTGPRTSSSMSAASIPSRPRRGRERNGQRARRARKWPPRCHDPERNSPCSRRVPLPRPHRHTDRHRDAQPRAVTRQWSAANGDRRHTRSRRP